MGVSIAEPDDTTFEVEGTGALKAPDAPLFVGNAGTATRFLTAAAVLADGPVTLDGDEHMRKRPIAPLADALRALGVQVSTPTGCPPVTVQGLGRFPAGAVEVDAGLSSQYVSALLMAAGCAEGEVTLTLKGKSLDARGYVDLTRAAMAAFGGRSEAAGELAWRIEPTGYRATDFAVEPDASAATYPWAWAALTGGTVDLGAAPGDFSQPDARAYDHIAAFPRMPMVIDGSQMQDAVPTLAVLAAYNETPVRFTGVANLRVKECDRIAVLAEGLNRIRPGLAREDGDELVVEGSPTLRGATVDARIDPHADHRMAMSFALAGLATGGIVIEDPDCVAKTYPGYWDDLAALGVKLSFHG
jgi:3-phosphoshikimate 1-carboxyvinyltransferase